MRWVDLAGYAASSLVFLTFYMKGMVPLRVIALCSNVAFLIYG
jgi:CRP/FNR family cyclic AMP-dependent transcriptional regulator